MAKRLSLDDKAKMANDNERHCRQCNHRVCPDGLLKVCSEAFIRGYKKGYKQNQKEQKERIDKILHPVTEPCGSNAIFVFFRDVRSGELQPYIEDMRMPNARRYQDIGSIKFSPEKDEPQKLQIAWCYPKDLLSSLDMIRNMQNSSVLPFLKELSLILVRNMRKIFKSTLPCAVNTKNIIIIVN